jgi:hypothetical protein
MPQVFFGPHGANNDNFANAGNANLGRFPLGHTLILPDGREYRFTLNDGTVEVAGNLYQSVAPVANHSNVVSNAARAIGATAISATLGATAAGVDIYSEGLVHTNDNTGEGYSYRIRRAFAAGGAHALAATSSVLTVNLEPGESVQVALTTSSDVTFTRNRYHQATLHLSPATAQLSGVSPGVAAADRFYWSQVKGYAAVAADLTLLAGLPVMPSIAQNGQVESYKRRARSGGTTVLLATTIVKTGSKWLDQDGVTTDILLLHTTSVQVTVTADITGPAAINGPVIGQCVKANASTEFALIDLAIP